MLRFTFAFIMSLTPALWVTLSDSAVSAAQDEGAKNAYQDEQPEPPRRGERRGGPRIENDSSESSRGPGSWRGRRAELSEEEITERLEVLRELHPELAERLETAREENPERFNRALIEQSPRLALLLETRRADPQLYDLMIENIQLERASHELSRRLRRVMQEDNHAEAAELRDELTELVAHHFDVRQQMRQRELHNLEQRLEQMRRSLNDREASRDSLIEERLEQLTGQRRRRADF